MNRPLRVAVLGGGRLANALVHLLRGRCEVRLWARSVDERRRFSAAGVTTYEDVGQACADVHGVFMAVPAPALADVAEQYGPHAKGDHVVLHASRGVGPGFVLPHQLLRAETCVRKIGVLGGPLYFDKLGDDQPLVAVLASRFDEVQAVARAMTAQGRVRLHPSRDVVGVEVCGAISNVAALAVGMVDALELGETARGVIMTRGLSEATRLGVRLGAELATFSGLAGVGDLIPRSVSSTRRHHDLGAALVRGVPLSEGLREARGTVEGVVTAQEAARLGGHLGLRLPLIEQVAAILNGTAAPSTLTDILRLDIELDRESLAGRT